MIGTARKLLTVATLAAVLAAPSVGARAIAAPAETPSPPADTSKSKASNPAPSSSGTKTAPAGSGQSKPADKSSSLDSPEFLSGYRAAYAAIYERNDYTGAIPMLRALGQDDRADVANLIGYSYRKLGDYDQSQVWYERALRADPNHVKTWQYYGLWQVERGNRDKAIEHLNKIGSLCGKSCPEYKSLDDALVSNNGGY